MDKIWDVDQSVGSGVTLPSSDYKFQLYWLQQCDPVQTDQIL